MPDQENKEDRSNWPIISGKDFVKALKGEKVTGSKGEEVSFLYNIGISVQSVRVKNEILITDDDKFLYPITLTSGEFQGDFQVLGGEFQRSLRIFGVEFQKDFRISRGQFQKDFLIYRGEFQKSLEILGGEFQEDFRIYGGQFQQSLWIDGGKFQGDFKVLGGEFQGDFMIVHGEFQKDFRISEGEFQQSLHILDGLFQKDFRIDKGEFQNYFRISGGQFQEDFRIFGGQFQEDFRISGGQFQRNFKVLDGEFQNSFWISGGEFQETMTIENHEGFFEHLNLDLALSNQIKVSNTRINKLELGDLNTSQGRLYLRNLSLNELLIHDFTNEGFISITDILPMNSRYEPKVVKDKFVRNSDGKVEYGDINSKSSLRVYAANLGSVSFLNIPFNQFDTIEIGSSVLTGITTTNGHIPLASSVDGKHKVYTLHKKKGKRDDKDGYQLGQDAGMMEEIYNHLYEAMKKSGNRTEENRYYAEYMEWHRRNPSTNWSTKASLWLNKKTTTYGQDWIRGALVTFGIALIFYWLLLPASNFSFGLEYLKSPYIEYHIGHFFQFILPIHRIDFLGFKLPGLALMVDFFSRLAIGFMIYQTIAAFRRFGKR